MLDSLIDFVGIMTCIIASSLALSGLLLLAGFQWVNVWDAWHRAIGYIKNAEVIYRYHTEDGRIYDIFPAQKKVVKHEEEEAE